MRPQTTLRIVVALVLGALALWAWSTVAAECAKPIEDRSDALVVTLYGVIILIAALFAALFATTVVPHFAEWIGSYIYNPDEQQEKHPHADALAAVNAGDYEGAIEAYEEVIARDPEDTHAISEIANIHCDKLHDCMSAAARLEKALQREWEPDKAAFLAERLADIYWRHIGNGIRARQLLEQITTLMPGTVHAANALHRSREIELAMTTGAKPSPGPGISPPETT